MNKNLTFVLISSTNDLHIEETLKSISALGRVLVIDGGPRANFLTDQPKVSLVKLADKYGSQYIARKYINSADQYNFGLKNVNTKWAFIIDSDEVPSPELAYFLKQGDFGNFTHYSIKRFNFFLGRKMSHGQFRPDWNIRLIQIENCKYEVRPVHARMLTNGIGSKAPGYLLHKTVQDIDAFFLKMNEFSKLEVEARLLKNHSKEFKAKLRGILQKLPFQASLRFCYSYWFRLGFLDGHMGYLLAKSSSYYEVMVKLHSLDRDG